MGRRGRGRTVVEAIQGGEVLLPFVAALAEVHEATHLLLYLVARQVHAAAAQPHSHVHRRPPQAQRPRGARRKGNLGEVVFPRAEGGGRGRGWKCKVAPAVQNCGRGGLLGARASCGHTNTTSTAPAGRTSPLLLLLLPRDRTRRRRAAPGRFRPSPQHRCRSEPSLQFLPRRPRRASPPLASRLPEGHRRRRVAAAGHQHSRRSSKSPPQHATSTVEGAAQRAAVRGHTPAHRPAIHSPQLGAQVAGRVAGRRGDYQSL